MDKYLDKETGYSMAQKRREERLMDLEDSRLHRDLDEMKRLVREKSEEDS